MTEQVVYTFYNTHGAISGERAMLAAGLPVEVLSLPAAISAGCGLCLALPAPRLEQGLAALAAGDIPPEQVYRREDDRYIRIALP